MRIHTKGKDYNIDVIAYPTNKWKSVARVFGAARVEPRAAAMGIECDLWCGPRWPLSDPSVSPIIGFPGPRDDVGKDFSSAFASGRVVWVLLLGQVLSGWCGRLGPIVIVPPPPDSHDQTGGEELLRGQAP